MIKLQYSKKKRGFQLGAVILCFVFVQFACYNRDKNMENSNDVMAHIQIPQKRNGFKIRKTEIGWANFLSPQIAVSQDSILAVYLQEGFIDFFSFKGNHISRVHLPDNMIYFREFSFNHQNKLLFLEAKEDTVYVISPQNPQISFFLNQNEETWYDSLSIEFHEMMECNPITYFNRDNRLACIDCEKFDYYYSFFYDERNHEMYQVNNHFLIRWDLRQCDYDENSILPFFPASFRGFQANKLLAVTPQGSWLWESSFNGLHLYNPKSSTDSLIWTYANRQQTSNIATSLSQTTIWVAYDEGEFVLFDYWKL